MADAYFGTGVGDTNITARVTLLGEFTGEEFVKFGAEDTVCDELALFADLSRHLEDCKQRLARDHQVIQICRCQSIPRSVRSAPGFLCRAASSRI